MLRTIPMVVLLAKGREIVDVCNDNFGRLGGAVLVGERMETLIVAGV